ISVVWDTTQKLSYDRKVGIVFVDDKNLNILLVEQGLADLKFLKKDMPFAAEYENAFKIATKTRVGRWR
ncbi:MAG: thermonuclease family protein, partial [Culicoidibacterales bacterium]